MEIKSHSKLVSAIREAITLQVAGESVLPKGLTITLDDLRNTSPESTDWRVHRVRVYTQKDGTFKVLLTAKNYKTNALQILRLVA